MADLYNHQMATAIRNVIKMTQARYHEEEKGAVPIQEYLELQMQPAKASLILHAFYGWYRVMYNPPKVTSDMDVRMELGQKTPIYVCAVLNEYARYIDELVATSSALEAAKDMIRDHGWFQGGSGSQNDGYCIMGALDAAIRRRHGTNGDVIWRNGLRALREAVQTTFLASWNDASGRTAGEVMYVLREVSIGVRMIR